MALILSILCFVIAYVAYKRNEVLYNPVSLYLGTWALVFTLYALNPYSLPQIHEATYQIYIVAFVAFLIGNVLIFKKPSISGITIRKRSLNKKIVNNLIVLMVILMVIPAIKALNLIASGVDLHDIRYVHHDDIMGDGIVAIAFVYFCEPFITFLIIFSVINLFVGQRKMYYVLLSVISLALMTIITGGRFFVLYFIASLLIATLIFKNTREAKKILKYSGILLILLVVSLIVISVVRGSDIVQTFYVYLSGCIPFMEERIKDTSKLPNMYGMASLYGFIRPIFVVLRKVLSMELPLPLQVVEAVFLEDDGMTMLTPEIRYNSFVSIFYSMYLDGGLIGVFIGNLLLGVFARYSFLKLQKDNPYKLVAYTLIAIIFLLSFFKLLVCSYTYALSFIYLYICFSKKKTLSNI